MKRTEHGVMLITTLIIAVIGLIMIAIILQLTRTGSFISGSVARYTSALEAARGGAQKVAEEIYVRYRNDFSTAGTELLACKAAYETKDWASKCSCSSNCTAHSTISDIINLSDWSYTLGDYKIYAKIINTKTAYSTSSSSTKDLRLYTIDVVALREHPQEKAWLTILYLIKLEE
ncbi:type IV pilus assembly protein PilX [Thermosulfidibacter takaii ABI70S6]|uniref:Type IV pilus assembly protein PilX n=1 Tax=Thermosulfidibacter takaii (strain DSM 17441 / JCM 13301 / NBRC 103674 / ABI70S6) TaxID=1298851 RepID=A0A0S3QUS5_THET7|nr:hypothetical protein [Thermosulfidibacter takaii]BAT72073.1 type IV pilus assembly protein PilX [Thermosulfidibacter takaii ABI70S6]